MQGFWVRISGGLFLLLQAGLLQMLWRTNDSASEAVTAFVIFSILTAVAGFAALGFLFLYQSGWLLAMMVQGMCLFVALVIYFINVALVASQVTMVYSIFMVLYLNSYFIRTVFRTQPDHGKISGESP